MEQIIDALCGLRQARAETLARMSQAEVVGVVSEWARRWQQEDDPFRREAEALAEPFPFAQTRVSLDALLQSLTPDALWELIDAEDVREAFGRPLVGHVIAGNTPLLAWVSVLRALVMRSASFVKLPSGPSAEWGRLFVRSLAEVAPGLAECVHLAQWPGGTADLDAALCGNVDLVMAHGGDETIHALSALCPAHVGFVGYGHRVSFGLAVSGATDEAARGFARDVLLYDQGGCLSPHTVFVEGTWDECVAFGAHLAAALTEAVTAYPQSARPPLAAGRVREARLLARMAEGTRVWEDDDLRWTVIVRPELAFALSPTHGVVSVQPLPSLDALPQALAPVADYLQGCAVTRPKEASGVLSRLCAPGELQAPPFAWRQDGRDVLRSLLPGRGQDDEGGV